LNNLKTDVASVRRQREMYSLSILRLMWSSCLKIVTDYNDAGSCVLFNDQITCNDDV